MIIDVDIYQQIREMTTKQHMSQRAVAKALGISRNTVKKYCDGNNVPWERKEYIRDARILTDDVLDFILKCLEADKEEGLDKQSHTARRIFHRLVDEKGFNGGESTVRLAVKEIKGSIPKSFVPLEFDPGEAMQIDWGEATIYLSDVKTKVNLFCARLCFSCSIFVMAFMHQNEESFLEGQRRVAGLSSVVGSVLIGIILHLFFVKITIPFYHLLLLFVLFSIQGLLIGVILAGITLRFRKTETLLNTLNILLMILIVLPLASVSDLFWHIPSLLCPLWGIVTYYQQLLTDPYSPVVLWNLLVVVVNTGFLAFVARACYNKLLNTTKIKGFLGQY